MAHLAPTGGAAAAFLAAPKTSNTPAAATMGLVRPNVNIPLMGMVVDRPVRRSLTKKLLDAVSGSFEQYDGDNTTKGYDDEDSEAFAHVFENIPEASHSSAGHHFDISMTSSSRLDTAVQKRRERLREKEKRRSITLSVTNIDSDESSDGSAYQTVPVPMTPAMRTAAM